MLEIVIVVNVVISLAFLIGGYYLKEHTSPNVDAMVGFKTKRAMASTEAWRFANHRCGALLLIIGLLGFVMTAAAALFIPGALGQVA